MNSWPSALLADQHIPRVSHPRRQIKEPLRGQRWVLESDLKTGNALKLDKSGKAILTVLRHLGRISEARVSVEGTTLLAILLQD